MVMIDEYCTCNLLLTSDVHTTGEQVELTSGQLVRERERERERELFQLSKLI